MYSVADVERAGVALHYPVTDMGSRAKLSCVTWNGYIKPALLAADYEGGITLWDATQQQATAVFEEHAKRVWSVDFSQVRTHVPVSPVFLCIVLCIVLW